MCAIYAEAERVTRQGMDDADGGEEDRSIYDDIHRLEFIFYKEARRALCRGLLRRAFSF